MRVTALCVLAILCCVRYTHSLAGASLLIERLIKLIQGLQVKKTSNSNVLLDMVRQKGVYESFIKLNLHGREDMALVRDHLNVFDNNMFVTAWVSTCLLEAFRYGTAPPPNSQQLRLALDTIATYRDRNRDFEHSIMVFWPQTYNSTTRTWVSTPENMINAFGLVERLPLGAIEELLKLLGLGDLERVIKELMSNKDVFVRAFRIPPDFDDTFVNLGLGSLLSELKSSFPSEHAMWMQTNTNISSVFAALKHYAYRPFSNESRVNTIDPRSYFYLRHFLEKAKTSKQDVALVGTWIQDIDEARYMYTRGDVMPFNMNNVDVTVSANTLYGITAAVLSGVVDPSVLDDPGVQKIYLNTSSMIAFELQTNLTDRRDLAQTYYPSLYEFYWFVARTVSILTSRTQRGPLPHKALRTAMDQLSSILRNTVTNTILQDGKASKEEMYFDDFLGDGDFTKDNVPLVRGEDRIFTTAMAINTLIQTWTTFDEEQHKLFWLTQTPPDVKTAVQRSAAWLVSNTLNGQYKPWNVFFSGSGKGHGSMPFWYPINRMEYLNRTKIPDHQHFPSSPFLFGFQGVASESSYLRMCNETHFGERTPMTFPGFNAGDSYFPFWSSDAYTYASTVLALSQYENLHEY